MTDDKMIFKEGYMAGLKCAGTNVFQNKIICSMCGLDIDIEKIYMPKPKRGESIPHLEYIIKPHICVKALVVEGLNE